MGQHRPVLLRLYGRHGGMTALPQYATRKIIGNPASGLWSAGRIVIKPAQLDGKVTWSPRFESLPHLVYPTLGGTFLSYSETHATQLDLGI